ncbi:MAG: CotH kinase family protein [Bacteroidales bacterium]|nr:CotH kinase family protein [Bacteroidales bacterium]
MKHLLLLLAAVCLFCSAAEAAPVYSKTTKYRIASLNAPESSGLVVRSTPDGLKLFYEQDVTAFGDSAMWRLNKSTVSEKYSFFNPKTKKFLKLIPSESGATLTVESSANAATDSTIFFTMSMISRGGNAYYGIKSTVEGFTSQGLSVGASGSPVTLSEYSGLKSELFGLFQSDSTQVSDTDKGGDFFKYLDICTINGRTPVYDQSKAAYYYTMPERQMGTDVSKVLEYKFKSGTPSNITFTIDGNPVASGEEYSFGNVTPTKVYKVIIAQGENELAYASLYFTSMPIVQIFYTGSAINGYSYTLGKLLVNDPVSNVQPDTVYANYKYRGATAQNQPKKSYAIKLVEPTKIGEYSYYESVDKSFLGLREDNNWILDAMAIDPARMRNRVATDLWNDFSAKPYYFSKEPKAVNGTRGKFVELFVNNVYRGIYCMTEKVDRKQLKLKKFDEGATFITPDTIKGALYKAKNWSFSVLFGNTPDQPSALPSLSRLSSFDNSSESWDGWEVKYPDAADGAAQGWDTVTYTYNLNGKDTTFTYYRAKNFTDWQPLRDAVAFAISSDSLFAAQAADRFDLPVLRDYYLFIELLLATDNHGKNMFFSVYDQTKSTKMTVTPWDLDGTFGRRWNGNTTWSLGGGGIFGGGGATYGANPDQDFISFLKTNEHAEHYLFQRLKRSNVGGFYDQLKSRYAELRQDYFKPENLINRFVQYRDNFVASGAADREVKTWSSMTSGMNFTTEISYLTSWINARIAYLDAQYGYSNTDEGIMLTALKLNVSPNPVSDLLIISNLVRGEVVSIYDQQGRVLHQQRADMDAMAIDFADYASGLYIVKAGNRSEKVIKR